MFWAEAPCSSVAQMRLHACPSGSSKSVIGWCGAIVAPDRQRLLKALDQWPVSRKRPKSQLLDSCRSYRKRALQGAPDSLAPSAGIRDIRLRSFDGLLLRLQPEPIRAVIYQATCVLSSTSRGPNGTCMPNPGSSYKTVALVPQTPGRSVSSA